MADHVFIDREGEIATITVNRPKKRNAMDISTRKELHAAFEEVSEDNNVRTVVLRGAGDESFIAGGDIDSFSEFNHMDGIEYGEKYAQGLYNYIAELPKPTIAAVDGYALGGGMEIALACDIRLATEDAKFGLPEVGIGVIPAGGGTQRLVQTVGSGIASELILTGRIIDTAEAKDIGLVNHVYSNNTFDDEVRSMAENLTSQAPVAQRLAKDAIRRSLNIDAGLEYEQLAGAFLFATDDQKEGADAFLNNRSPEYEGQ